MTLPPGRLKLATIPAWTGLAPVRKTIGILYFKSPSLGKIMFIAVDASPDDNSEVERLPEGIAELTKR